MELGIIRFVPNGNFLAYYRELVYLWNLDWLFIKLILPLVIFPEKEGDGR